MNRDLRREHVEYEAGHLTEDGAGPDPFELFSRWMEDAFVCQAEGTLEEPSAMVLSTVDVDGQPHSRVVLLKEATIAGFAFYTNYSSDKGVELASNPRASLLFFWPVLQRQIRIDGVTERLSTDANDDYFAIRPRGSQLGAWASEQSRPIESLAALRDRFAEVEAGYEGASVPRPVEWGGYRLVPASFEFWQGQPNRLHDRIKYSRVADGWQRLRLNP